MIECTQEKVYIKSSNYIVKTYNRITEAIYL